MAFTSMQLPCGRWGIYCDSRLLATIGCPVTLDGIYTRLVGNNSRTAFVVDPAPFPLQELS